VRLILALLLTIAAYSQVTTARYGGVLTDVTGLPLLHGSVHLMETRTGLTYKAAVEEGGRFQIPAITPGVYTVRVESPGFATRVIHDYALSTGEAAEETIEMELAELNITVEVVGKAPGVRVQTADAQISRILTLKELDLLPQLARDPMALAAYQPGVQFDGSFSRARRGRRPSATSLSPTLITSATTDTGLRIRITSRHASGWPGIRSATDARRSAPATASIMTGRSACLRMT